MMCLSNSVTPASPELLLPSFLTHHTSPWASILSVSRPSSNAVTLDYITTFVATEQLPQPPFWCNEGLCHINGNNA
jgi:hypothetical protein